MVVGINSPIGQPVMSHVMAETNHELDIVQTPPPRMAVLIAMATNRRYDDATHKLVQVCILFVVGWLVELMPYYYANS